MASGSFVIEMTPAEPLFAGSGRMHFTKVWSGDFVGTGEGDMLSAGDPGVGIAGYVAFERFDGSIDGAEGSVCLQQFGTMQAGETVLRYEVVPGSGTGGLHGLTGVIDLLVDEDGTHRVTLIRGSDW